MTDVEPPWEACKVCGGDHWTKDHAEAAAGPEPESPASAWLEGYKRGRIEAEAAAGPREAIELCPECGGQYSDLPGHRRLAHNVAAGPRGTLTDAYSRGVEVGAQMEREAAAGPRDEGLEVHINDGSAHDRAMAWSEGHTAGYDEALAAGSRDEGLDVERLAQAMREHIASIRKDNDDSPCVEHCARDIARRYEAAAGPRDEASLRQTLETYAPLVKRDGYLNVDALLATIRPYLAEAAAGPRETFVGPGGKRIEVKFAEAAAGPRGDSPLSEWDQGYVQAIRDYGIGAAAGLDVERLARAMQNVEDELTATNIAYEYAALAKASDHD